MGPTPEALAMADYLIEKLGLTIDRIALAYACMTHVEEAFGAELDAEDAATPPAPQRLAQGDSSTRGHAHPPEEYTDWEKRVWQRGYRAGMDGQQPPHHDRGEVFTEPGAIRALVTAANAVLAANPADDSMWTLELAVRPFNATKPAECANGCPANTVCDYCQIAALTEAKQQGPGEALTELDRSIINEAAEVLEAVGVSGVTLPANWRWPLADELSGIAAAPQVEAKRQTGEGLALDLARLTRFGLKYKKGLGTSVIEAKFDGDYVMLDDVRALIAAAAKPSGEVDRG